MTLRASWVDRGREPSNSPDPDFPYGRAIDLSEGKTPACEIELKHPAPRCGYWIVSCDECNCVIALTTAGRPDDPCKLKVPCKEKVSAQNTQ